MATKFGTGINYLLLSLKINRMKNLKIQTKMGIGSGGTSPEIQTANKHEQRCSPLCTVTEL